ncbi:hypothetical protein [Arthrobacter mangrovi]|uniref:Uncharacterized protein n=1 Tax=Arthrobacter mangrovi TaxID=2966350 RepID=A0ABQ5MW87_9MICC|nr:hypothetical protein [Arthrobacter mangrovi]GLB67937.1 hypothetical protein AHIS1636_23780 [Arthrobacter mangrovi]
MFEQHRWALENAASVAERDALRRQIAAEELQRLRAELGPVAAAKIERRMLRIIEDERQKDIRSASGGTQPPDDACG